MYLRGYTLDAVHKEIFIFYTPMSFGIFFLKGEVALVSPNLILSSATVFVSASVVGDGRMRNQ